MKQIERFGVLLMAGGTGMAWIMQYVYLVFLTDFPDWIYRFYALGICIPAAIFGCFAYPKYGGFTKGAPLVLAALLATGVAWTDATEYRRGVSVAISFAMTLPISALLRKHNYLKPAIWAFGTATAASMLFAMTQPMVAGRWGMLIHSGTMLSNPASVGLQCATAAALLLLVAIRSLARSAALRCLQVGMISFLLVCCILTASRTAFLALVGASCVALLLRARHNFLPVALALLAVLFVVGTIMAAAAAFSDRPFYDQLLERTVGNEDETLTTLGGRTDIWYFGADQFLEGSNWIGGVGTGGVDKTLGQFSIFRNRDLGSDGIWRLYAHNTLVWCGLGLGTLGLIVGGWLTLSLVRSAYRSDHEEHGWERGSLVAFLILFGTGAVVHVEPCWILLGSVLWAIMSNPIEINRQWALSRAGLSVRQLSVRQLRLSIVPLGAATSTQRRSRA
jgi:hypothetical protein